MWEVKVKRPNNQVDFQWFGGKVGIKEVRRRCADLTSHGYIVLSVRPVDRLPTDAGYAEMVKTVNDLQTCEGLISQTQCIHALIRQMQKPVEEFVEAYKKFYRVMRDEGPECTAEEYEKMFPIMRMFERYERSFLKFEKAIKECEDMFNSQN